MDTLSRMRAFVDVVEAEGFSAAARKVGKSKALLSKYVRELEDELGALLLNRTTRQLSLTEAGHTYFARTVELLRDVEDLAEAVRDSSGDVRGRIKLSAPRTFADAPIGQSLIDFAKSYPDITLDIHLDDRFVDLVEEGFDLAIRITKLADSSLIAKRLAPFRVVLCASPELIAVHGEPKVPEDLTHLPCIVDTNGRYRQNWPFKADDGDTINVPVTGRLEVNSPMAARAAALSGLGFAILPDFIADPEISAGRLVPLLQENNFDGAGIYAIYPHRRYLPAKVRAFVDHLARWLKENYPNK
ncbi:LysR family transcriptional regulator [uncultured Nitratireductor sp.]|uniref:LysR family transcriptional regulator n=1 Tax=uncultured Nitratireductor sp. TaxID=520953 RepID=UPI0025D930D1|nr:LysR family transcriptional regulator [uncultured Nitratireductor sp.]